MHEGDLAPGTWLRQEREQRGSESIYRSNQRPQETDYAVVETDSQDILKPLH